MRAYITNLKYEAEVADLRRWLEEKGLTTCDEIFLPQDHDNPGMNRGYGFFSVDAQEWDQALALDGEHMSGRKLRIVEARLPSPHNGRSECGHHEG